MKTWWAYCEVSTRYTIRFPGLPSNPSPRSKFAHSFSRVQSNSIMTYLEDFGGVNRPQRWGRGLGLVLVDAGVDRASIEGMCTWHPGSWHVPQVVGGVRLIRHSIKFSTFPLLIHRWGSVSIMSLYFYTHVAIHNVWKLLHSLSQERIIDHGHSSLIIYRYNPSSGRLAPTGS